jgi:serine/threonine protein kinase
MNIKSIDLFDHAHVIRIIGCCQTGLTTEQRLLYMLMHPTWVFSLEDLLQQYKHNLEHSPQLCMWFKCTGSTLAYVHSKGFVHGNGNAFNFVVKGTNIYRASCDYMERLPAGEQNSFGQARGLPSPRYAAREAINRKRQSTQSDVFLLGVVYLQMLAVFHDEELQDMTDFLDQLHDRSSAGFLETIDKWYKELGTMEIDKDFNFYTNCVRDILSGAVEDRPTAADVVSKLIRYWATSGQYACVCDKTTLHFVDHYTDPELPRISIAEAS